MSTHISNRLIVAAVLACALAACSDILEVSPRTAIAPDDLGQREVEQLLNGVYREFQNAPGLYNPILFDLLGGNLIYNFPGRPEQRWIESNIDPNDGINNGIWRGYYSALYRANVLLELLDNLAPTPRNQEIRGIAHFFRGYAYYGLVTRYGGVPILEQNTRAHVPRQTEAEVWDFVRQELDRAIEAAPRYAARPEYFYVTSEAAKALRARTALATGELGLAATLAEELITSGPFQLETNFESIFRGGRNSETIFAFENRAGEGIAYASLFTPVGFTTGGSHFLLPAVEVRGDQLFAEGDSRKDASIAFFGDFIMVNKYLTGIGGGDPIIVTRIAEMYLISAEARGLEGLNRLNELRQARGLAPISVDNESAYQQAVAEERRRELLFEGFRWFDLKRTGRAIEELTHVTSETQLLLPIPVSELDLNPLLEQNPGY